MKVDDPWPSLSWPFNSQSAGLTNSCVILLLLQVKRRMAKVLRRQPRMQKKLGEVVYKGHYSYNLMLELQLGIRYSVGRSLRPRTIEKHSLIAQLGVLRPWWSTSSVLSSSGVHSSSSGSKGPHVGCFSGLRHHHEDHEHQQQHQQVLQQCNHQQQVHQHVQQQLEAVLAGATGGGDLVEEDFREELTVFFPSSGRYDIQHCPVCLCPCSEFKCRSPHNIHGDALAYQKLMLDCSISKEQVAAVAAANPPVVLKVSLHVLPLHAVLQHQPIHHQTIDGRTTAQECLDGCVLLLRSMRLTTCCR